jgi:hypothetical protein
MAFSPHFGILGGSAEWEPQYAPEGQDMTVGRNPYPEFDHNLMLPPSPEAGQRPNRFMFPDKLPYAEEFRPHRPLSMVEIQELGTPGGAERVAARLRAEQAPRSLFDDGADLPMPPGGFDPGLPQTAPLPPRRPPGFGGY